MAKWPSFSLMILCSIALYVFGGLHENNVFYFLYCAIFKGLKFSLLQIFIVSFLKTQIALKWDDFAFIV